MKLGTLAGVLAAGSMVITAAATVVAPASAAPSTHAKCGHKGCPRAQRVNRTSSTTHSSAPAGYN
jgi:hypothetical protein